MVTRPLLPRRPGYKKQELKAGTPRPRVAANAQDDRWALPRSRDAFMQASCNAPLERDLDPRQGTGRIGHMGYFRQQAQPLWDNVLVWFMTDLQARSAAMSQHIAPEE